jgi:hypothetical protein
MSLGSRLARDLQHLDGSEVKSPQHYQDLAAYAIALADYTKPRKYTVEALFLYAGCEYMRQDDSQVRLWMFMAIVSVAPRGNGLDPDSSRFFGLRYAWATIAIQNITLTFHRSKVRCDDGFGTALTPSTFWHRSNLASQASL